MADLPISSLPSAGSITPGTDVMPIVFDGTTCKATVSSIVASALATGRSVTASLAAPFDITASNGTYDDTGLSIAIPAAGTWFIYCGIVAVLSSPTQYASIVGKFYDSTAAADVADSILTLVSDQAFGIQEVAANASLGALYTVSGASTIKLYAKTVTGASYGYRQVSAANLMAIKVT